MVMGSRNSVNFGSGFTISHILSLCSNKTINPRIQKDWILDILDNCVWQIVIFVINQIIHHITLGESLEIDQLKKGSNHKLHITIIIIVQYFITQSLLPYNKHEVSSRTGASTQFRYLLSKLDIQIFIIYIEVTYLSQHE